MAWYFIWILLWACQGVYRWDSIYVVVDRFSKTTHFIPFKVSYDASKVADLFSKEIIRYHGLPSTITLDWDICFMSNFWKNLWLKMGTTLQYRSLIISPYHPQTDCQTKVVNRTSGNVLKTQVKSFGRWDDILPKIEFEFNCLRNWNTAYSPFEVLLGANPREPLQLVVLPTYQSIPAEAWMDTLTSIHEQVSANLQVAYDKYKSFGNCHKNKVSFQVGDEAWVNLYKDR